jgi:K+-sensing histidine kinase KdpD
VPAIEGMEDRIRTTARYAATQDAKFTVLTVRPRSLSERERELLGRYATQAHQLGGEFVRLEGGRVAPTIANYLVESKATEVVLGHRRRGRWTPWDTTSELIRRLSGIDVHILRSRSAPGG